MERLGCRFMRARYVACDSFSASSGRVSSMIRFLFGLMALGLLIGLAGDAKAQPTYSFTTLDVPGSSENIGTGAFGINASGQIVGSYADGHGFLLDNGGYTTLEV